MIDEVVAGLTNVRILSPEPTGTGWTKGEYVARSTRTEGLSSEDGKMTCLWRGGRAGRTAQHGYGVFA